MQMQHAREAFGAYATFLGNPLPDDPIAALQKLRRDAADEVERLLALLDALDGDPELEPALGSLEWVDQSQWAQSEACDREPTGDEADHSDAIDEARPGRIVLLGIGGGL